MSLSNAFENAILALIFNATTFANVAINATSSPITDIHMSLHTGDPGEAGDQTTSEATYTLYARVAVVRTGSGWTVATNTVVPVAQIAFPTGSGGSGTVTHYGYGKDLSGAGVLFASGTVTPNIVTGNGVQPILTVATTLSLD